MSGGDSPVVDLEAPPDQLQRYLHILGLRPAPPSRAALFELVRAQLQRVPFENISKISARLRGEQCIPSLERHLDGIEDHGFGGTCYANNPHFYTLLKHLDYEATMCGADMSAPDVHIVILVRVEGREYLVDVGYAAPFFEPLPRDLVSEHELRFGSERYVLHPQDENRRSRLDVYRDGERIHGYLAKPEARPIGHFEQVIRQSYDTSATFQNAVVLVRFSPGRALRIHNLSLTESTRDGSTKTELADRDRLIDAIVSRFGMRRSIVEEAVWACGPLGDIYG